jgi:hypothetical protein
LRNAKGVYSLNIGVTYNTPTLHNHKQAAVEWVKALREQNFEAYYYHVPDGTKSSICVGTFGEDALVTYADGGGLQPGGQRLAERGGFHVQLGERPSDVSQGHQSGDRQNRADAESVISCQDPSRRLHG